MVAFTARPFSAVAVFFSAFARAIPLASIVFFSLVAELFFVSYCIRALAYAVTERSISTETVGFFGFFLAFPPFLPGCSASASSSSSDDEDELLLSSSYLG